MVNGGLLMKHWHELTRGLVGVMSAAALWLAGAATAVQAQVLAMPDSTNNRLVLFDPFNGAVINPNFFALAGGTPIHAIEVGGEIWVSEQIGDRISRWGMDGSFLGAIGGGTSGGLDNIRGMALVGSTVYVTNAGTANGAPGGAVVMFNTSGALMGSFATPNAASPFALLPQGGSLLVASSTAADDIHRYSLAGASLGTFHDTTALAFTQQMAVATNGNVLAAGFSSNNIVRLDAATGSVVGSFTASGARGLAQLGNGNILWTSGTGAFVYDVALGSSTQVYAGGGRHLGLITAIPEPGTWALWLLGLAGLAAWRTRRA
jgi:MYXO-CTERM domain-containing protein